MTCYFANEFCYFFLSKPMITYSLHLVRHKIRKCSIRQSSCSTEVDTLMQCVKLCD